MNKLITFLLIFFGVNTYAQTTPDLETDRPDQTETPFSVGKYMFQAENGFARTKIDSTLSQNNLVTLLRFGISEKFELRAEIARDGFIKNNNQVSAGLQPIEIGFKTNLLQEKGWIPKTSLIAHLAIPTAASKDFKGQYYSPNFRFTMQHTLSKKQSLSYNLGGEWDTNDGKFTPIYTLASGYDFTNKLYGYVEFFGAFPQKEIADHNFDVGFAYLLKSNLQLDISAGVGLTTTASDYYYAIGFSFRLPK